MTNRTIILFHLGPNKSEEPIQHLDRMWEAFFFSKTVPAESFPSGLMRDLNLTPRQRVMG